MALLDQPRTFNDTLELVPGASVYFFVSGTDTPTPAYGAAIWRRDSDNPDEFIFEVSSPHPNPMVSDSAARLPPIFLDPDVTYRMLMLAPDGSTLHDLNNFSIFPGPELITPYTDDGQLMPLATLTIYASQTTAVELEAVASAEGVFEAITLDAEKIYRIVLKNQHGELTYDVDPYPGSGALIAGGGVGDDCMCPKHALVVFNSPGDIERQINVENVAWDCGSAGVYRVFFTPGYFDTVPVVTANAVEVGPPVCVVTIGETTVEYVDVYVYDLTGQATNGGVHVQAWGLDPP